LSLLRFLYYLLHIPAIHLAAIVVSLVREGRFNTWLMSNHPVMNPPAPEGYMWPLWLLYAVFIVVVALLYPACRWYWQRKTTNPAPWMRYI